jgi:hypothetical protein
VVHRAFSEARMSCTKVMGGDRLIIRKFHLAADAVRQGGTPRRYAKA